MRRFGRALGGTADAFGALTESANLGVHPHYGRALAVRDRVKKAGKLARLFTVNRKTLSCNRQSERKRDRVRAKYSGQSAAWTRREMHRAATRFKEIFGFPARTHGAAGWQMNPAAYAGERELGFDYASDGRGSHPFQPVDDTGAVFGIPQIPTTLPTLDELIGLDGLTAKNVDQHVLALTADQEKSQVYTLHAELEGMRLAETFERLLAGWQEQGYRLVSCRELFATLDTSSLPRHHVTYGQIAGRSGNLALQGPSADGVGGLQRSS